MPRTAWVLVAFVAACASAPTPETRRRSSMLPSARYATRAIALHWQGPDGPAIGRLLPGAQVWAVAERGEHAEVELPVSSADASRAPVRAWVSRDALALEPTRRPRVPDGRGQPIVDQRLVLQAGGQPFALTSCEPGIVTAEGEGFRVTQRHGRVEVSGWVAVVPERASAVCRPPLPAPASVDRSPPAPPPLPVGYEPSNASTVAIEALRTHLSQRGRIWQLAGPIDHERCDSYAVEPDDRQREGRARGQLVQREANGLVRTQGYVLRDTGWYIDSPIERRRLSRGVYEESMVLCGGSFRTLVGGDEVRWVFSTDELAARAYDPNDVERWYPTERAARKSAARASSPASTTAATERSPRLAGDLQEPRAAGALHTDGSGILLPRLGSRLVIIQSGRAS